MILGRGTAQTDEAIIAEYLQLLERTDHSPAIRKRLRALPTALCRSLGTPILHWSDEEILTVYQDSSQTRRGLSTIFLAFLFFRGYHRPSIPLLSELHIALSKQWTPLLEPARKSIEKVYCELCYKVDDFGTVFHLLLWVLCVSHTPLDELTRAAFEAFRDAYQSWYRQSRKNGKANTSLSCLERCLVHAGIIAPVPKVTVHSEDCFPDLHHPPFQTAMRLYMQWRSGKYKSSTVHTARYGLVVFFEWLQEDSPEADRLDAVSRTIALAYAQHLKHQVDAGKYGLRYQRSLYTSIRQFFDFVIDEGLETAPGRNPFSFHDVASKPEMLPRYLSDHELRTVLAYCEDKASLLERTMVITLLHTGIRALEFAHLKASDIVQIGGVWKVHIHQGKGLKDRLIPLTPHCLATLQAWQAKGWEQVSDYLFTNYGYVRPQSGTVGWTIRQIGLKLGIQGLTPHRFRHSFAVALLNYGIRESALQKLMGHATLNMTLEYARILDKTVERAFTTAVEHMQEGSHSWVPNFFIQEEYTLFAEGDSVSWIRLPLGFCRRNPKLHCESDVKCLLCDRFYVGKEDVPRLRQMHERFLSLGLKLKADVVAAQIQRLELPTGGGPSGFIPTNTIFVAVKHP